MKAFSVSFSTDTGDIKRAVVIAPDMIEAVKRTSAYCAKHWAAFHICDIVSESDTVILGQFPKEWEDGR